MTFVYAACRTQIATGALQLVVEDDDTYENPELDMRALPSDMAGSGFARSYVKLPRVPGSAGKPLGGW